MVVGGFVEQLSFKPEVKENAESGNGE